jgi:hypothetical protein
MKRTYLDSSVLIQAVQGVDGDKTAALLEDPEREFVAATFLKLEWKHWLTVSPAPDVRRDTSQVYVSASCSPCDRAMFSPAKVTTISRLRKRSRHPAPARQFP